MGASTGYRWFAPEPPDFWSLMRSVWDAVIAGTFGPGSNAFAWGGSMAIRRETFYAIRVPDFWRDTVSDDYALSAAVARAGLRIVFAPGAMAVSAGRTSGREFLAWARRQLTITRVYRPRLWWTALAAHIFYCGGMAAAIIASIHGSRGAEWALIAQLSPGHAERRQSRHAGQSRASRVQSLVRPACLGAYAVGSAGDLDLADRAGRLGLRQSHRVAREPLSPEVGEVEGAPAD